MHAAYDYRFGVVNFRVEAPGGLNNFLVSIVELFKSCNIHPDELRMFAQMIEKRTEIPNGDIEGARMNTLRTTDWKGKTVLDVGGYDGFAAEIAIKGGAARAICIDNHQYEHYGWKDVRKAGVEYIQGDFMDWVEPVDIVIFYNVLYHLKNPWAALEHVRRLAKEQMLLCTLFKFNERPEWYLYEPRECNPEDETVFWGPSALGLERMLKATGWDFEREGMAMDRLVYRCQPTAGYRDALAEAGAARA